MTVYNERKAKKRGNKGHMVQKREQDKAEKSQPTLLKCRQKDWKFGGKCCITRSFKGTGFLIFLPKSGGTYA